MRSRIRHMKNHTIDNILRQLQQGKRCYYGFEDSEFSTIVSIEKNTGGQYTYTCSINHKYDVVSPAQYENRIVNEDELHKLLSELSEDVLDNIHYADTEVINENTQEKVNLIYSYLRRSPKVVYVVFKEMKGEGSVGEREMNFNSLFSDHQQAEHMADYIKSKQGVRSYWKEVTLVLNDGAVELRAELSPYDKVNASQILIMLLDMDPNKLETFFEQ